MQSASVNESHTTTLPHIDSLWLELTPLCNLSCSFCYNDWRPVTPSAYPRPMPAADLRVHASRLIQLVDYSVVVLSGGEPLLYRDLVGLTEHLASAAAYTVLTTNGVLLTPFNAERLRDAGLNGIQVSILASNPEIHDELAGRDSWRGALRALLISIRAGFDTTAVFTATRLNIADLRRTAVLLGELGVSRLLVNWLQEAGSAAENADTLRMDREGFVEQLELAQSATAHLPIELTAIPAVHPSPEQEPGPRPWHRMSVAPDGLLKVCNMSPVGLGHIQNLTDAELKLMASDLQGGRLGRFASTTSSCSCLTTRLEARSD